jgi:ribonuclease R
VIKTGFLRSLKRAVYDLQPLGHYGLAKVNYTHFTSPIRRYADLIVHRVISREKAGDAKSLAEAAAHISKTERTSADAEKDSTQLKKMEFFQRQLTAKKPQEFAAIVVDVRSMGVFVELPDVQMTGLIHVSTLGSDFYEFDATRQRFIGRRSGTGYKLGDRLTVVVARVDPSRRQIDFAPVAPPVAGPASAAPREAERAPRNPGRGRGSREKERPRGGGRGAQEKPRGGGGEKPSGKSSSRRSRRRR